ncbi:dipeptidase [Streptomyces sp. LP05-1]|uniref:Dipeptidase n=1 Tax=Streptomyces pyxinae TaxID=2970734 RepID=A0ABT2CKR5_9ACTN|nr:dipeptidase [Streptomyces sp. LP05-1]MCS0637905.1 dipeptidase [Streptomyces sp. LP05-1]
MADLQHPQHPITPSRPTSGASPVPRALASRPAHSCAPTAPPISRTPGVPPRGAAEAPAPSSVDLARARVLLAAQLVVDGHNTLAQELGRTPWQTLCDGESTLDVDIPRIRAGGVGAQFWALHPPDPETDPETGTATAPETGSGTGPGTAPAPDTTPGLVPALVPDPEAGTDRLISSTLDRIDAVRSLITSCPESLSLARTAREMADARDRGRVASLLGPVAGAALGDSLGTLRAYHALGVRSVSLAGTHWAEVPDGLTAFGEEVIRELNRLGVLADLSGAAPATMHRVLDVTSAPVMFSRSAAYALTPHPANVPDDLLRRLRANGGVCMVGFAPELVENGHVPPAVRDVADHLEHVREVAGPESVGISGSYGSRAQVPHTVGLEDASCYPHLIAELLHRDWPESDIAALTWGNAVRVVREAADLATPPPP